MSKPNKEKYIEIVKLLKRLSDEMSRTVESYYIWRTLYLVTSIKEVGKELAERNVEILNLYKDFFIPTEESHLHFFIIGVSKFFDPDDGSLSLYSLLNKINANKEIFISETLIEVYPNRPFDKAGLGATYLPIKEADIYKIKKDIKDIRKQLPVLIKLKDIRKKQSAHTDIKITSFDFIPDEVPHLINAIQEVINKISYLIDRSYTKWDKLKDRAVRDTKFVLESLYKNEQLRRKEIKERYN